MLFYEDNQITELKTARVAFPHPSLSSSKNWAFKGEFSLRKALGIV